jgi:hypothetical protein
MILNTEVKQGDSEREKERVKGSKLSVWLGIILSVKVRSLLLNFS